MSATYHKVFAGEGVGEPAFYRKRVPPHAFAGVAILCLCLLTTPASAWTGRRAVLYTEAQVMLTLNEPWVWGKSDCSSQLWRLLSRTFPELRTVKWFKRTTTEIMATWPWDALLTLDGAVFGDLLFANSEEYPVAPNVGADPRVRPLDSRLRGNDGKRPARADFQINHVLMHWDEAETAIHAGKNRGFSKTNLRPYWWPRLVLAIRPPY